MLAPVPDLNEAREWAFLVRECRRKLGLKQFAFAEMLGTSQSAVSRWEAGTQVPGFAMQNKVRDLLHRPLYNDRADRVVVAQVRHAVGHVSLFDRDIRQVVASTVLERDHGGMAGLRGLIAKRSFRDSYEAQLERCSWRVPLFNPEVVLVDWVAERLALGPDGDVLRISFARTQWTTVTLSCGRSIMRGQSWDISEAEWLAAKDRLPDVLTLDDLA